ncbi:tetratricopeptide repeat protein [Dactylosporangium aurantiacum]|uniref:Tetratricopeptide repeat protein n=1 Tax=Dactylosporangium aurantiacum TaxID=35754 RepID=A0A9Q9IQT4_9ACTN|nr:BTAD domain-containing putative transcriptional regulator [Dactylosporangium aurantiacum]MDG6106218.1 BTAD domain-containing putative transcriptional regulator [Dactylosporangium aurantiacum]UWZ58280.1 tetratricopeptide repeat protein [Dactylosporangium aurantiacum]
MRFGLLGPVEVREEGRLLPAGGGRARLVLACLLVDADRLSPTDLLIAALWQAPPSSAKAQLHNLVSGLRRRYRPVDPALIETRPTGYTLRLGPHRLDLADFRALAERGRAAAEAGDHTAALALLDRALALWRGPALADLDGPGVAALRETLHRERLAAAEVKLDVALALGDHDTVLREVEPLVAAHPYAERLYRHQMLALAGAGRRAEALAVYRRAYRRLVDDVGMEPGPLLRATQRRILHGRPVAPPAAPPARPVPRQLPPAVELAGRGPLLEEIAGRLDGTGAPVVLLVGPGGVGKSGLAVAVAHRLRTVYPDGQLYADLRGSHGTPADPHRILERFLRALGVPAADLPADPEERVTLYRSHLAAARMLVVLDDAADEAQLRPLLTGSGGVLVTSRRQLAALLPVARFVVPALPAADAVRLLATGAGEARVAADPAAAREIVRLCGGLPLAVCIVAARLAVRPGTPLDELRRRLAAQRGRLDELTVGDLDVRASIALSHDALPADARRLLLRLSLVTAADWPRWVAQALLDAPAPHARTVLDQLAEVHLVEPLGRDATGQDRFRLHELVAEYARERHRTDEPPAERDGAVHRLLDGWLALAGAADELLGDATGAPGPRPASPPEDGARAVRAGALDWFETERAGLVAAVDQATAAHLPDVAAALALRMSTFLGNRGYADDWEHTLRTAIRGARAGGSHRLLARLLDALFKAHLQRDEHPRLPAVAAEQLAVATALGDVELQVLALRNAGLGALRLGRFDEAFDRLERAVATARGRAAPGPLLGETLDTLGFARWDTGDAATAVSLLEEALAVDTPPPGSLRAALRRYHYGLALTAAGRLDDAGHALTAALRTSLAVGDDLGTAYVEQALADVATGQGRLAEAAQRLERSLAVHRTVDRPDGHAETLRALGDLAAAEGRWSDATAALHQAVGIWQRIGATVQTARGLARLERVAAAAGDEAAAAAYRGRWRSVLGGLGLDESALHLPAGLTLRP